MRCENCGNEFFPGDPCSRCGHSPPASAIPPGAAPPPEGGSAPAPGPGAPSPGPGAPPAGSGAPPGGAVPGGGTGPGPPTPPPAPTRDGPPWERERSLGSLLETLKGVLLEPTRTFREAAPQGAISWALLYWLIFTLFGTVFMMFWNLLSNWAGLAALEQYGEMIPELDQYFGTVEAVGLLYVLWLPASLAIGIFFLFAWAGIVHLLLMMLDGANHGFEATFRAVAYGSGSAAIFQAVPACGGLVGLVWSMVAQIIGLKELQNTSGGKAAFAVLGPLVFCCACGIALGVLMISLLAAMAGG